MTISGDSRLETIAHVIEEEMKKLKSRRTVLTHPLKRGLEFNPYIKNTDGESQKFSYFHESRSKRHYLFLNLNFYS